MVESSSWQGNAPAASAGVLMNSASRYGERLETGRSGFGSFTAVAPKSTDSAPGATRGHTPNRLHRSAVSDVSAGADVYPTAQIGLANMRMQTSHLCAPGIPARPSRRLGVGARESRSGTWQDFGKAVNPDGGYIKADAVTESHGAPFTSSSGDGHGGMESYMSKQPTRTENRAAADLAESLGEVCTASGQKVTGKAMPD